MLNLNESKFYLTLVLSHLRTEKTHRTAGVQTACAHALVKTWTI